MCIHFFDTTRKPVANSRTQFSSWTRLNIYHQEGWELPLSPNYRRCKSHVKAYKIRYISLPRRFYKCASICSSSDRPLLSHIGDKFSFPNQLVHQRFRHFYLWRRRTQPEVLDDFPTISWLILRIFCFQEVTMILKEQPNRQNRRYRKWN